jgi:hypothetical protein
LSISDKNMNFVILACTSAFIHSLLVPCHDENLYSGEQDKGRHGPLVSNKVYINQGDLCAVLTFLRSI